MMIFDKEILETRIINANSEILIIAEQLISQLLNKEQNQNTYSVVRRYIASNYSRNKSQFEKYCP